MELWEVAKKGVGQPPKFESPEQMLHRAYDYFAWCKEHPLIEPKAFSSQGEVIYGDTIKMRAMTQEGLCVFLNVSVATWHNYKAKPEYLEVTKHIEGIMRDQKFSGAAAGFLNPNIIARDLGLKDASEVEHSGSVHNINHNPEDYKKAQELLKSDYKDLD